MKIFRNYTREALDAEYNNRDKVDSAASYLTFWSARSSAMRAEGSRRLDLAFGPSLDEKLDVFMVDRANAPIHFFHIRREAAGTKGRFQDKRQRFFCNDGLMTRQDNLEP